MRSTAVVSVRGASNIRVAMNAAELMGLPLNRYVVINFGLTSCPHLETPRAFAHIRELFRRWVTRGKNAALKAADTHTFENPTGQMHVNWSVHIPAGREEAFAKRLTSWIMRATGGVFPSNAVKISNIWNAGQLALYFIKGADKAYTDYSRIRHEPQGEVPVSYTHLTLPTSDLV